MNWRISKKQRESRVAQVNDNMRRRKIVSSANFSLYLHFKLKTWTPSIIVHIMELSIQNGSITNIIKILSVNRGWQSKMCAQSWTTKVRRHVEKVLRKPPLWYYISLSITIYMHALAATKHSRQQKNSKVTNTQLDWMYANVSICISVRSSVCERIKC